MRYFSAPPWRAAAPPAWPALVNPTGTTGHAPNAHSNTNGVTAIRERTACTPHRGTMPETIDMVHAGAREMATAGITPNPDITATAGRRNDTIATMTGTGDRMAHIITAMFRPIA